MVDPTGTQQFFDLWRKQFEEGAATWARLVSQAPPAAAPQTMDPMAFWRPVLNSGLETWARLFATTPVTPDLMQQWKQFLDQWIAAWSKVLEQAMGTETFAKAMGKQMETFLNVSGPVRKAADQQIEAGLAGLGLPSRTQVVNVAAQIVQLEDKIDGLEDRIDALTRQIRELAGAVKERRA